jgi:DNA-binding PadR family transcriptional regulator
MVGRARPAGSSGGPHRRYYALSHAGQIYLNDGRQQWKTTGAAIEHLLNHS